MEKGRRSRDATPVFLQAAEAVERGGALGEIDGRESSKGIGRTGWHA